MSIFYGLHAAHPKYFSNYLLLSFSQTASLRLKTEILQLSPKLFAWINFSLYKLQAELYFHFANMTIYFFFSMENKIPNIDCSFLPLLSPTFLLISHIFHKLSTLLEFILFFIFPGTLDLLLPLHKPLSTSHFLFQLILTEH